MTSENQQPQIFPDPADRDFEVAHAQGNGLMAREAAGIITDEKVTTKTPREILDSDDPNRFSNLAEVMVARLGDRAVPQIVHRPKTFREYGKPKGWRARLSADSPPAHILEKYHPKKF